MVNPKKKKGDGKAKAKSVITLVKGSGDYSVGEKVGGKIGSYLGGKAQSLLASIFGFGDYKVVRNSLYGTGSEPPMFSNTRERAVRVQNREYLFDLHTAASLVNSATPFNIQTFSINPANSSLFPWLSTLADSFEQYEFHGLIFEFKSMSADALNSTNTALGTVILSTQYNSLDAPFVSKLQMEQHEFTTSTVPSCSAIHPVECATKESVLSDLYVNNPGTNVGDPRFVNLGLFNIATTGMQAANVNLGEVWVSYDISLKKTRLPLGGTNDEYQAQLTTSNVNLPFASATVPSEDCG
jgi:hypothetical protein